MGGNIPIVASMARLVRIGSQAPQPPDASSGRATRKVSNVSGVVRQCVRRKDHGQQSLAIFLWPLPAP